MAALLLRSLAVLIRSYWRQLAANYTNQPDHNVVTRRDPQGAVIQTALVVQRRDTSPFRGQPASASGGQTGQPHFGQLGHPYRSGQQGQQHHGSNGQQGNGRGPGNN